MNPRQGLWTLECGQPSQWLRIKRHDLQRVGWGRLRGIYSVLVSKLVTVLFPGHSMFIFAASVLSLFCKRVFNSTQQDGLFSFGRHLSSWKLYVVRARLAGMRWLRHRGTLGAQRRSERCTSLDTHGEFMVSKAWLRIPPKLTTVSCSSSLLRQLMLMP